MNKEILCSKFIIILGFLALTAFAIMLLSSTKVHATAGATESADGVEFKKQGAPVIGLYEGELEPVITPMEECESSCGCEGCTESIEYNYKYLKTGGELIEGAPTQGGASAEFQKHRNWMIDVFFKGEIAYGMSLMSNQLTAVMLQQVKILGGLFDAKHQLETQRIFQTMMAQAHADYQPSDGMCEIGTMARGLISSERKTDAVKKTLSNRVMARQLRQGRNLAQLENSDMWSRIYDFKQDFCQRKDNGGELATLCIGGSSPRITQNKDVDYTRTVDSNLTIELNTETEPQADQKAVYALMANLFAHQPLEVIGNRILADGVGNPRAAAMRYQTLRSVAAKRSVASNSMAAIISERASGDEGTDYGPYVKRVLVELGVYADDINFVMGRNPSYFAQMEILTKKIFQNPVFYTELYDKPVNVLRKGAAIRAIGLMQDRDLYKSLLRNEAVLAVTLETMLYDEHESVFAKLSEIKQDGQAVQE